MAEGEVIPSFTSSDGSFNIRFSDCSNDEEEFGVVVPDDGGEPVAFRMVAPVTPRGSEVRQQREFHTNYTEAGVLAYLYTL